MGQDSNFSSDKITKSGFITWGREKICLLMHDVSVILTLLFFLSLTSLFPFSLFFLFQFSIQIAYVTIISSSYGYCSYLYNKSSLCDFCLLASRNKNKSLKKKNYRLMSRLRKKCKGKLFAVKYKSFAEWIWQIKANWVQDPFDPVKIIWPTMAQILLV